MKSIVERFNSLLHFMLQNLSFLRTPLNILLSLLICTDIHKELCNFMGVLTRRRHFNWTCPIEVKTTKSISQMLQLLLCQTGFIHSNIKMSRQNTSLSCRSRSKEEVKLLTFWTVIFNKPFVNDAAWRRIDQITMGIFNKESLRNSLVDHNHSNFWLCCTFVVQEIDRSFKLRNFSWEDLIPLSITDTISVNDNICRELILVVNSKRLKRF